MKKIIIIIAIILSSPLVCNSKEKIEDIAANISSSFKNEKLHVLGKRFLHNGIITIEIEHSISLDKDTSVGQFSSWNDVEKWLQNKKIQKGLPGFPDLPIREGRDLYWCKNGLCLFNLDEGIGHNHLYLKKIWYIHVNDTYEIYGISLLDGD